MYQIASTTVPLDRLKSFAVRDPAKLTVGSKVIFGHVPELGRPDLSIGQEIPSGFFATITEVSIKAFNELYPGAYAFPDDGDYLVIFYHSEDGQNGHIYATDTGVLPFRGGEEVYSSSNFVVLLEELEAEKIRGSLSVSEGYLEELEAHNLEAVAHQYPEFFYGEYEEDTHRI